MMARTKSITRFLRQRHINGVSDQRQSIVFVLEIHRTYSDQFEKEIKMKITKSFKNENISYLLNMRI